MPDFTCKLPKKLSFIPRLAYGTLGVGLGVLPLAVTSAACGSDDSGNVDTDYVYPAFTDASFTSIGDSGDAGDAGDANDANDATADATDADAGH